MAEVETQRDGGVLTITLNRPDVLNAFDSAMHEGFRSALKEAARVVYNGLIRIEPGAQQTEAFQSDHNLLLSEKARADSTPILEILTDDVRCKHGATAGPVDPEELFYLLTRGFGRDEALRTLVLGFFEPVLRRIPSEEERERLGALLEERL